jgi:hypothetical protein
MDRDRESMVDAACTILYAVIPMFVNYFLNYASALIAIYFIGTSWLTFSSSISKRVLWVYLLRYGYHKSLGVLCDRVCGGGVCHRVFVLCGGGEGGGGIFISEDFGDYLFGLCGDDSCYLSY